MQEQETLDRLERAVRQLARRLQQTQRHKAKLEAELEKLRLARDEARRRVEALLGKLSELDR